MEGLRLRVSEESAAVLPHNEDDDEDLFAAPAWGDYEDERLVLEDDDDGPQMFSTAPVPPPRPQMLATPRQPVPQRGRAVLHRLAQPPPPPPPPSPFSACPVPPKLRAPLALTCLLLLTMLAASSRSSAAPSALPHPRPWPHAQHLDHRERDGGGVRTAFRWTLFHAATRTTFVVHHRHADGDHSTRTEAWANGEVLYVQYAGRYVKVAVRPGQWSCLHDKTLPVAAVNWHEAGEGEKTGELEWAEPRRVVVVPEDAFWPRHDEGCWQPPHTLCPEADGAGVNYTAELWGHELLLARALHATRWQAELDSPAVEQAFAARGFSVAHQRYWLQHRPNLSTVLTDLPPAATRVLYWRNCSIGFPLSQDACLELQTCATRRAQASCGGRVPCSCVREALERTALAEHARFLCGRCTAADPAGCVCWSQWLLVRALLWLQPCGQTLQCASRPLPLLCAPLRVCQVPVELPCEVGFAALAAVPTHTHTHWLLTNEK